MDLPHPAGQQSDVPYAGHRILEAMRSAPRYADAIYAQAKSAAGGLEHQILEFGAGDGTFVERFLKDGYKVACIEPDIQNQEALRALGVRVASDISEVPDASYAYVYTINVLEHLTNLDRYLGEINRVMIPGGRLFAFTPAFNLLWTSLDDEVGHVRRFTRRSLAVALERAQLVIEDCYYFDSLGFFAALGVRVLEKGGLFRYSPSSVGLYDKYMLPISKIGDRAFLRLFGKNVIALACKPSAD